MTCATCGAENRDGAKFCSECGAPTAAACPVCTNPVDPSDKFCAECGSPLAGTPAPAAPVDGATAPIDELQERRFVTAMFIDIVGFTPLTEQRDSEEVRQMLTRYFDRARDIVERFGGVIDKYIGDAVMAVWGAHVNHEDDAERAVRAALELIDAVADLGETEGMAGLQARAGVLSGEAAVGGDGNATTGLIIGDTVNIASRLQSAAEPGAVLVGRSTRDLASSAILFESVGQRKLKGKSESVEAFQAIRVVGGHGGARRADGLTPPFVGRADELRLLKDNLHAVERDGRLRLVSIIGQGGIGKSRLVDELWNYVDGLTTTYFWHHGRSPAYGEELSYWAVGEMVRQRCGIAESDDDHRSRTRLRTTLAEVVPDADDRAWMEPRLESLLGLTEESVADRIELFAAWRMFFTAIAGRGPTVMVFEDLHWADDGMLDFIEEFVGIVNAPILIVTLGRPDLLERRPGWGSGRANSVAAYLAPLSPATMKDLVRGVVPDAPAVLVDRLADQAGGIPLYAVELLRMLLARGAIEPIEAGLYRVSGEVSDIDIPESLHGLIGARIDQFDPGDRSLIADAAILGQSFTLGGLAALREEDSDSLAEALEPLVRREILSVNRDPRSPERGQYRFVQSIIREVAHQRVSRSDRHARHVKVAEYFDSLGQPEVAGVVASHYLDAVDAAPDGTADTDRLRRRTIEALLSAADRAGALQSHPHVVRLCRRGIEIAESESDRGELLIRAARSAHAALDADAEGYALSAIEAFEAAGDLQGVIRASTTLAKLYNNTGRGNEGWERLEPLVLRAGDEATPEAISELARSLMLDAEVERGLEWCDAALAAAERDDSIPAFVDTLITKGVGLGLRYRTREALILLNAGLELSREHHLTASKRRVLNNLEYVTASDAPVRSEFSLEKLEDAKRIGEPRMLTEVSLEYAWVPLWSYRWDEVDEILASIDPDELPPEVQQGYWGIVTTRQMLTGDLTAGIAKRRALLDELQSSGDRQTTAAVQVELVQDDLHLGRFAEAYDRAERELPPIPLRLDLWYRTQTSILLHDRRRISETAVATRENQYRGRYSDLLKHATRGGLAAIDGEADEAAIQWERAIELAETALPLGLRAHVWALAAVSLGLDHPFGRKMGRKAYDTWASAGVTTMLDIFQEGVLAPESASDSTKYA